MPLDLPAASPAPTPTGRLLLVTAGGGGPAQPGRCHLACSCPEAPVNWCSSHIPTRATSFLPSRRRRWGKGFRNGWRTVLQPLLVKAAAKRWVREVQRDRAGPGLSRLEPEAAMSTRWPPAQGAAQPRGSGSSEKRREGPGPSLVLTRPGHWDSGSVREHLPHARRRPLPPPGVLPGFSPPEDLDQSCC